jgi:hypothetical protein
MRLIEENKKLKGIIGDLTVELKKTSYENEKKLVANSN